MPASPIQTHFDGGEVSQRISGRFDSPLHGKALKKSFNFEPLAQGSLRMRSGSLYAALLDGDTRKRFIQIRVSSGDDYILELLDKKAHIWSINGLGISALGGTNPGPVPVASSELITNGDFAIPDGGYWLSKIFKGAHATPGGGVFFTDPTLIDPVTNAATQLGYAEITNGQNDVATGTPGDQGVLYQKISALSEGYAEIKFSLCLDAAKEAVVKISTTEPSAWADATGGGDVMKMTLQDGVNGVVINVPPIGHNPISPGDFSPQVSGQFANPNGVIGDLHLPAGDYYISFQFDAGPGHLYVDDVGVHIDYINAGGPGGTPGGTEIPTPWTANEVADVQYDTETGRDRTIITHFNHTPWAITYGGPGNWTFGNIAFTAQPAEWGQVVPGGGLNYPRCVQIHAGRTYYAGEPLFKNRVRASKSNDPDNFTIGSNPGDALDFKIATKGAIRWVKSSRVLLMGTDLGHYSITGSTGIPLVGDTQIYEESSFQGAPIQAIKAGRHAIFATSDFRRLRATLFDLASNGWDAKDLTFAAEHITAPLIKELHHAYAPDSVTVTLFQDGTLGLLTFEPAEGVLAWWTANVGAPIATCAIVQGAAGAYVWMAVNRNGRMTFERLSLSEGAETLQYLDAYVEVNAVAAVIAGDPGIKLSGLGHLAGLNVTVIFNGIAVPATVIARGAVDEGTITLTDVQTGGESLAGQTVTVGYPYKATAITMPRNSKTGRAHSSKLGVILNNSRLPKINGKRPADRGPSTAADTVEELFTGKKTVVNSGWSDLDEITIEQDLPFRTEVCALYALTEVTD